MNNHHRLGFLFTAVILAGCLHGGGQATNVIVLSPDDAVSIDEPETSVSYAVQARDQPVTVALYVNGEQVDSQQLASGDAEIYTHRVQGDPGEEITWRIETTNEGNDRTSTVERSFQISEAVEPVEVDFAQPGDRGAVSSPVVFDYNITTPSPATFEILVDGEIMSYRSFSQGTTSYQDSVDLEPGSYTWNARVLTGSNDRAISVGERSLEVEDRTIYDIHQVGYAGSRDTIEAGQEIGFMVSLWLNEPADYTIQIENETVATGRLADGTQMIDHIEQMDEPGSYDWQVSFETIGGNTFETATQSFTVE